MSTNTSPDGSTGSTSYTANNNGLTGLRLGLAQALGNQNSFGSNNDLRDHYDTFGWVKQPDPEDYLSLYLRNGYARTVVDKPALTTWRDAPRIIDDADSEDATEFEQAVEKLAKRKQLWEYATRADRLAGIAQHGLMVFGFSDIDGKADFESDARESNFSGLDDLNQIRVYHEDQIEDIDYGGADSERWGLPVEYTIDLSDDVDEETEDEGGTINVHWTRVIDIPATRLLDDETLARPRVEPVLNNILDIEKTLGSVAEMAYRGADKGLHVNFDPEKVDTSNMGDVQSELERWYHDVQPWIKTTGGEVTNLGGEVANPEGIIEPNLDQIAATTGIPKRELRGNQQGEQAGAEQDTKSYHGVIEERREQYGTPYLVRPPLERLQDLGILPDVDGDMFSVDWPDLTQLSESDVAELQQKRSKAIANVATVIPDLRGERAEQYIETGEFPDREDPETNTALDESNQRVQEQFGQQFGLRDNQAALDDAVDLPASMVNAAEAALENDDLIPDSCGTGRGVQRRDQIRNETVSVRDLLTRDNGTPIPAYATSHAEDFSEGAADTPVSDWTEEMWQQCGNAGLARWGVQSAEDIEWLQEKANELARERDEPEPY